MTNFFSQADAADKYLTFLLGNELFGCALLGIREVMEFEKAEPIAEMPEYIEGLVRVRGDTVMAVDLRKILGTESYEGKFRLLFPVNTTFVATSADHVLSVAVFEKDSVTKDCDKKFSAQAQPFFTGVTFYNETPVYIFDFIQLLTELLKP